MDNTFIIALGIGWLGACYYIEHLEKGKKMNHKFYKSAMVLVVLSALILLRQEVSVVKAQQIMIVNRYTGNVRFCNPKQCWNVKNLASLPERAMNPFDQFDK